MGSASTKAFIGDDEDDRRVPQSSANPAGRAPQAPSTNVFDIRLYILAEPCQEATGDPVLCENCQAVLNSFSQISSEGEIKTWKCEFCGCKNRVDIDAGEVPGSDQITYVLEGASQAVEEQKSVQGDETTVLFAIDTSGSMGVTQPINVSVPNLGRLKLNEGAGKHISRLQCVQLAVDSQISNMQKNSPMRKVGLVQFAGGVRAIGGQGAARDLPNQFFMDFDACIRYFEGQHDTLLRAPIGTCATELSDVVYSLKPNGGTALGPGLLTSLSLASEGNSGSKIIICTDGLANNGLGNVELSRPADVQSAEEFYEKVGQLAQRRGVSISVISLVSSECRLNFLASMAELTEGSVLKVDPMRLSEDFEEILSEKMLATEVKATVILHKALKFKNETTLLNRGSKLVRVIGNASQYSSFTFEYANKTREELTIEEVDLSSVTQIPFQLILEYKNLRGAKMMKCVTKVLAVSRSHEETMQDAKLSVMARNLEYQGMNLAQHGQYEDLKRMQEQYQGVLNREGASEEERKEVRKAAKRMEVLQVAVQEQEVSDRQAGVSQEESESGRKQKQRAQKDKLSVAIHQLKKAI